jgi:hypothetical protein
LQALPPDDHLLEDGIWRLWNLSLDEPYFEKPNWKGGWYAARNRPAAAQTPRAMPPTWPPIPQTLSHDRDPVLCFHRHGRAREDECPSEAEAYTEDSAVQLCAIGQPEDNTRPAAGPQPSAELISSSLGRVVDQQRAWSIRREKNLHNFYLKVRDAASDSRLKDSA